jgi:hypothetical protein
MNLGLKLSVEKIDRMRLALFPTYARLRGL